MESIDVNKLASWMRAYVQEQATHCAADDTEIVIHAHGQVEPQIRSASIASQLTGVWTSFCFGLLQPGASNVHLSDPNASSHDAAEGTEGIILSLTECFSDAILAERLPWAGPTLTIVRPDPTQPGLYLASVPRRRSMPRHGALRVELQDIRGQRSEAVLTPQYYTDEFPTIFDAQIVGVYVRIDD